MESEVSLQIEVSALVPLPCGLLMIGCYAEQKAIRIVFTEPKSLTAFYRAVRQAAST
jgi:hypothetical protein